MKAFDLFGTHVLLENGGAAKAVMVTSTFWPELIAGDRTSEDVRHIADTDGWFMANFSMRRDSPNWEKHPGDEILYMLSGALEVILEERGGNRTVALDAGGGCVVPRGVWHRTVVRTPGELLAITYGRGTQHRSI